MFSLNTIYTRLTDMWGYLNCTFSVSVVDVINSVLIAALPALNVQKIEHD